MAGSLFTTRNRSEMRRIRLFFCAAHCHMGGWEMKFLTKGVLDTGYWIHVFTIFMPHNKISRHHFIAAPHPEERAYWPLHCIHKGCRLTTPLLHCTVQLGHSIKALHLACFVILHTKMRSVSACWPLHCIHKGCRLTTPLLHCMVQLGHSIEALHLVCLVILHRKMRP